MQSTRTVLGASDGVSGQLPLSLRCQWWCQLGFLVASWQCAFLRGGVLARLLNTSLLRCAAFWCGLLPEALPGF